MTDDDLDDLGDDDDDDGDDLAGPTATGRAAVLCTVETLGVRLRFCPTLDDALRLAAQHPCPIPGCLGHVIAFRDDRGQLRTVPAADGHEVIGRFNDLVRARDMRRFDNLLRAREVRRQLRHRVSEADRQRRRRAAKRATLQREDPDDVDPG